MNYQKKKNQGEHQYCLIKNKKPRTQNVGTLLSLPQFWKRVNLESEVWGFLFL